LGLRLSSLALGRLSGPLAASASPADHRGRGDHRDPVPFHGLAEDLADAERLANALDQLARVHLNLFRASPPRSCAAPTPYGLDTTSMAEEVNRNG
jgi:hypothetical protein